MRVLSVCRLAHAHPFPQLLVPLNDKAMQIIQRETANNPRHRLQAVAALCSKRRRCEAGVDDNLSDADMHEAIRHGGCGKYQPRFRRPAEDV